MDKSAAPCTHILIQKNSRFLPVIASNWISPSLLTLKIIEAFSPDIIINTAAYTAVDKAEEEADLAMLINHQGAKTLLLPAIKIKFHSFIYPTDYIFDGQKLPYVEDDSANPINIYGKSKWLGEEAIREQCNQHIILRVSAVFSEYGNNFLKTILRLANDKKELKIVADQITCPTYAGNIATVIYAMIADLRHWGTWHYCDSPEVSWHQFASDIIQEAKKHRPLLVEKIHAISSAEYKTAAKDQLILCWIAVN